MTRFAIQCAYHDKDLIANRTDPSINLYHKHKHTHQRPVTVTHIIQWHSNSTPSTSKKTARPPQTTRPKPQTPRTNEISSSLCNNPINRRWVRFRCILIELHHRPITNDCRRNWRWNCRIMRRFRVVVTSMGGCVVCLWLERLWWV